MAIPIIDERVKHVGATALRGLTAKALKGLEDVMVIQSSDDEPLAVVLPYSIYLEIQQALWPASIIPSLETVFGPAADVPTGSVLSNMSDDTKAGLIKANESLRGGYRPENSGTDANPDMEHSMDSYREGAPIHRARANSEALCDGWVKGTPYVETENPALVTCATCRFDRLSETPCEGTVIGVTPEPRGAKLSRVDDSKPPVFDDIDEERPVVASDEYDGGALKPKSLLAATIETQRYVEEHGGSAAIRKVAAEYDQKVAEIQKVCAHCGNPHSSPLCSSCFVAGHRNGNCLICGELEQSKL